MNSKDWFKGLVEQIKPLMTNNGFKKSGSDYIKNVSQAEVVLGFRRSRETTIDELVLNCSLRFRYFVLDKYYRDNPPLHMQGSITADKTVMCRELVGGDFAGFWRVNSDASYSIASQQIFELVPALNLLAIEYSSPEKYVSEYLAVIDLAAQGELKINTKEATVVAAYFLETTSREKAEKLIDTLREIAHKEGSGVNALNATWNYLLQKHSAS